MSEKAPLGVIRRLFGVTKLRSSALTFWLLLFLSIPVALWVRLRALRLDEAAEDRRGIVGRGPPIRLLAAGDSIIAGVGVETVDQSLPVHLARALAAQGRTVHWQLHGANGADISELCGDLENLVVDAAPDIVLISIGVNDVTGLTSLRQWHRRFKSMLSLISVRWPESVLIFAGLPPMNKFPLLPQPLRTALGIRSTQLDNTTQRLLNDVSDGIHVPMSIDSEWPEQTMTFSADGFHPDAAGCKRWAGHLVTALKLSDLPQSITKSSGANL